MNSEAKLKRIELKLKGKKSVNAVLTTEKFMPQTKLTPINITSTVENLVFEETCEPSVVMWLPCLQALRTPWISGPIINFFVSLKFRKQNCWVHRNPRCQGFEDV
jgi:hypothetical protein